MNKKIIYLFIALLLPGLIFLFLKFFGKNKFDIPVYFEHGVSDSVNNCKIKTQGQYFIADSALKVLKWKEGTALLIYEATEEELKPVTEVVEELPKNKIRLFSLDKLKYDEAKSLKNCVLFLQSPWNAILIDGQKRIRGYYSLGNRDEIDRLDVELKILLTNY